MKQAEITVEYKDHMGTDLTVVNAARTSFGKESSWDWDGIERSLVGLPVGEVYNGLGHKRVLKPADANLIRFLATGFRTKDWDALLEEIISEVLCTQMAGDRAYCKPALTNILHAYKRKAQHWAPFAHPHMQIRMKLPMFLARQFVKHQVGGEWSEESRRYMSSEPEFWFPKEWHSRPSDVKQGSGYVLGTQVFQDDLFDRAEKVAVHALNTYEEMVAAGVAPEEARIVLPLNTMTTVTWTGSLLFWSRVCNQRLDNHAQKAANDLAAQIAAIAQPIFPVSWAALVGE